MCVAAVTSEVREACDKRHAPSLVARKELNVYPDSSVLTALQTILAFEGKGLIM